MALRKYTKEWLEELVVDAYSYAEVLRRAGRKQAGGNQSHLKGLLEEFEIDISHFTGQNWNKGKTAKDDPRIYTKCKGEVDFNKHFIENSSTDRQTIRRYIIKYGLIEYKCAVCENPGEWRGESLALDLDHINGVSNDHRLENLRYLCPNCHALTPTYRGRKNKKE